MPKTNGVCRINWNAQAISGTAYFEIYKDSTLVHSVALEYSYDYSQGNFDFNIDSDANYIFKIKVTAYVAGMNISLCATTIDSAMFEYKAL